MSESIKNDNYTLSEKLNHLDEEEAKVYGYCLTKYVEIEFALQKLLHKNNSTLPLYFHQWLWEGCLIFEPVYLKKIENIPEFKDKYLKLYEYRNELIELFEPIRQAAKEEIGQQLTQIGFDVNFIKQNVYDAIKG